MLLSLPIISSTISKYLNSPIYFMKMRGENNLGQGLTIPEDVRNSKGRKMENNNRLFKKYGNENERQPNINIIPVDDWRYFSDKKPISHNDSGNFRNFKVDKVKEENEMIDDSKIVRPEVSFLSNARPSLMAWREVEMEETPIMKPPKRKQINTRLNKKYSQTVQAHLGYSRNLVDYSLSSPRILQKKKYGSPQSSLVWLQPTSFNGLPQKLVYRKPLLMMRNLDKFEDE